MKKIVTQAAWIILCMFPVSMFAQNASFEAPDNTGAYTLERNDANHPCISADEYKAIETTCAENMKLLHLDTLQHRSTQAVALNWPLKAAAGFNDCGYYVVSAYVDENTAASAITDYNCGTNTYDGHKGTDIAIAPFPFYKMDNSQVEVIAAAAGTILARSDGNYDRNCATNSLTANYLLIQHADGSCALYYHMKNGSVTSKIVGQTVALGEYVGVVGSSGNSSGPHLHFEVWSGTTSATYKDPYFGTCNLLNASTWWATQKSYTEPAILKASVHTTDIVLPACPTTETLNESTSYQIPFQGAGLSPGMAKFYIFIRNQVSGTVANLSILNPDQSVFNSWIYNCTTNCNGCYFGWSKTLPTVSGNYTFKANYNGQICSQVFTIINPNGITENSDIKGFQIYPNPSNSHITITLQAPTKESTLTILNLNGQELIRQEIKDIETQIDISNLAIGVYFAKLMNNNTVEFSKIIKE